MTTTIPTLSAVELRAGLQELLEFVDQAAALEARIESKALELHDGDWGDDFATSRYVNALAGQLRGIFTEANPGTRGNAWDPNDLAEDIRAALDILDLSTKGADDAS